VLPLWGAMGLDIDFTRVLTVQTDPRACVTPHQGCWSVATLVGPLDLRQGNLAAASACAENIAAAIGLGSYKIAPTRQMRLIIAHRSVGINGADYCS
jgi:hypothetical protein